MATAGEASVSTEEFKFLTERAGLGLDPEELEALKPLYELYLQHVELLHSMDLRREEIGMAFHPDWPPP
jgi:hypothetical protein